MEKYNPVGWFEIPVNDFDRAEKFYTELFGFEFNRQTIGPVEMSWFPMDMDKEDTKYGACGTLIKGETFIPSHEGTLVYFSVESVEEFMKKVEAGEHKVLAPKMAIGEHGFVAWIEDSEGNRIAVHSAKE